MASEERDGSGLTAMRQRERGIRAGSRRGGDTRDDFERNAVGGEMIHLFTETTEDTRVAAFKPDDETALTRFTHDHGVDLVLSHRVDPATLTDRHDLGRRRNLLQKGVPRQGVMDHDIRLLEQTQAPHGDQVRGSGSCTDEGHPADVTIYHLFKLDPYLCNPNSSYQVLNHGPYLRQAPS